MMSQELLSALPAGVLAQVGRGVIEGGWNYVWVAYGLTWSVMVLYGLSLWLRSRGGDDAQGGDA